MLIKKGNNVIMGFEDELEKEQGSLLAAKDFELEVVMQEYLDANNNYKSSIASFTEWMIEAGYAIPQTMELVTVVVGQGVVGDQLQGFALAQKKFNDKLSALPLAIDVKFSDFVNQIKDQDPFVLKDEFVLQSLRHEVRPDGVVAIHAVGSLNRFDVKVPTVIDFTIDPINGVFEYSKIDSFYSIKTMKTDIVYSTDGNFDPKKPYRIDVQGMTITVNGE